MRRGYDEDFFLNKAGDCDKSSAAVKVQAYGLNALMSGKSEMDVCSQKKR